MLDRIKEKAVTIMENSSHSTNDSASEGKRQRIMFEIASGKMICQDCWWRVLGRSRGAFYNYKRAVVRDGQCTALHANKGRDRPNHKIGLANQALRRLAIVDGQAIPNPEGNTTNKHLSFYDWADVHNTLAKEDSSYSIAYPTLIRLVKQHQDIKARKHKSMARCTTCDEYTNEKKKHPFNSKPYLEAEYAKAEHTALAHAQRLKFYKHIQKAK
jgi:hypothetical protein